MPSFMGLRYSTVQVEPVRRRNSKDTANLKRKVNEGEGVRWRFRIQLEPTRKVDGSKVLAHRNYSGSRHAFDMEVPQPLGVTIPSGNFTVGAGAAAGAEMLTVRFPGSRTIDPGTFFTIAGDTKVYQFVNGGKRGAGNMAMLICPPLRVAAALNSALDLTPTMRAIYAPDGNFGASYPDGINTSVTIEVEERL